MLDLKNDKRFRYILIFKNHGEAAGATIDHSALPVNRAAHCPAPCPRRSRQLLALLRRERALHFLRHYPARARHGVKRVIGENEHFITLAPYAPRFPFEMWLLPKVHGSSYENNQSSMYASLARMLKDTLMRLDQVLDRPALNFMIHTSPIGEEINDHYHCTSRSFRS